MKRKIIIIFLIIISLGIKITYAKYVIEYIIPIAKIEIDTLAPEIKLIKVTNSNTVSKKYLSKKHRVKVEIEVTEKNIVQNLFNKENIEVWVQKTKINSENYKIEQINKNSEKIIYSIEIFNIEGNGKLEIKIPKGIIKDKSENINMEKIFDTGIIVDNLAPIISETKEKTTNGKVIENIKANETIIKVNGWNNLEDGKSINKEFECNVCYPLPISDLAENKTEVEINIKNATNIILQIGAVSNENYWDMSSPNNIIIGKSFLEKNPLNKLEMISLYAEGNISKEFIKMQAYAYTYWGENTKGFSLYCERFYDYGYNPKDKLATLKDNSFLARVDGNNAIVLCGEGMNRAGNKGSNNKKIPESIAKKYLYGISGITIDLNEKSYYSIVYQIYINGKGWQKVQENGKEAVYRHDKPISALRASLIPNTEKQYLIDYWNKDIGKNNI